MDGELAQEIERSALDEQHSEPLGSIPALFLQEYALCHGAGLSIVSSLV
jgi:hypothetical protein